MDYESQHNMKTDGVAGPPCGSQLLADASAGTMDPNAYNYVYVTKTLPRRRRSIAMVRRSIPVAQHGVAAAPTADGTFRCTCATRSRP